jgi:hypothetical protein
VAFSKEDSGRPWLSVEFLDGFSFPVAGHLAATFYWKLRLSWFSVEALPSGGCFYWLRRLLVAAYRVCGLATAFSPDCFEHPGSPWIAVVPLAFQSDRGLAATFSPGDSVLLKLSWSLLLLDGLLLEFSRLISTPR